ncbi:MAG: shikimate dehydrogenase [Betaproteobacteria bacterium]
MTDRYAVIGNPVSHTKSPTLQMAFARQCSQDIDYGMILGPLNGFTEAVRQFQRDGGKGINITVPFKLEAFEMADELTPRAQAAGAVNMFTFRDDGSILGDNTDGFGIIRDITANLGCSLSGKRVLLLGAGGAARGTLLPLLGEKPSAVFIANRTEAKALELAQKFKVYSQDTDLSGGCFAGVSGAFDVVINGTSASLLDEAPSLPDASWAGAALAYDMFYQKEPTAFMRAARTAGVKWVADGLGMVVEQGAECFFLWRGMRPDTAPVIAALR